MTHSVLTRLSGVLAMAAGLAACGATGGQPEPGLELSDDPMVGKFVWHDLMTDDVAAARRFYGNLFGWRFEKTVGPAGGDYTLIESGGRYIGGMVQLADPVNAEYSRWLNYLSVADVDDAVESTESAGGRAVVEPLDIGEIGRAAAVTDPQGAVLGLLRSRRGDPVDPAVHSAGDVVWNELVTADNSAAAEFYVSLAGFRIEAQKRPGRVRFVLNAQGRERAGIVNRPDEDVQPFWLTFFAVDDPAAAADRAEELGGEVLLAPSSELRGGTVALITDPAGAILALQQWPIEADHDG